MNWLENELEANSHKIGWNVLYWLNKIKGFEDDRVGDHKRSVNKTLNKFCKYFCVSEGPGIQSLKLCNQIGLQGFWFFIKLNQSSALVNVLNIYLLSFPAGGYVHKLSKTLHKWIDPWSTNVNYKNNR